MYAQTNGLKTYYEVHGEGTPLILLHGGLETCQMWAPFIPAFTAQYQVITPDSRGHGRTDNPTGVFNYSLMAADIAGLIQALGLDQPFVAGYSDGGQIALEMAMNYPGLARGYLAGGTGNSITDEWRQFLQDWLGNDVPDRVNFEHVLQTDPESVQSMQEKHDAFHMPGYWKTLLMQILPCWLTPLNYSQADFARITAPTLFWCGDRDAFYPPEQSLAMYRMVNVAELAVIPNADHFSIIHQLDIANEVLLNFMKRVAATE